MKHFHLDLHVNTHVIGTVIVSSLTIVALAAIEYTHLNSALAYEKGSLKSLLDVSAEKNTYNKNAKNTGSKKNITQWEEGTFSDEVSLNSAEEISEEVKGEIQKMKTAFTKVFKNKKGNALVKKVNEMDAEKKVIVLEKIEEKIEELMNSETIDTEKYNKRLGKLLAAKELFQ